MTQPEQAFASQTCGAWCHFPLPVIVTEKQIEVRWSANCSESCVVPLPQKKYVKSICLTCPWPVEQRYINTFAWVEFETWWTFFEGSQSITGLEITPRNKRASRIHFNDPLLYNKSAFYDSNVTHLTCIWRLLIGSGNRSARGSEHAFLFGCFRILQTVDWIRHKNTTLYQVQSTTDKIARG